MRSALEADTPAVGPGRFTPLALGACVTLGAALRVWGLGASRLNFDESFTAMVGRLPLAGVFSFLRVNDSHPPLDYLLQLPLARAGVSPFVFRLPAALCSIAALGLFAWWMRNRGRVAVVATAAMSVSAFQLMHAREARMYGAMELIGVAVAFLADSWLRAPRRRHAVLVGALVFIGLLTHVSMMLAAVGLLALAGRRRDRDAWRWRVGIAAGGAGWAVLWGPSFLVQSRGGHSSWIPRTTPARLVDTISGLVAFRSGISALIFAAIVVGLVVCRRRDHTLATVLVCCFVVPVVLAGLLGLRAPVLLDRTLSVAAWGPLLALGYLVDALSERARALGLVAVALAAVAMLPATGQAIATPKGPTAALQQLEKVARPGDVVAIQPASKGVELEWTLGVRSDDGPTRSLKLAGFGHTTVLALTGEEPSGRIWLMQYRAGNVGIRHFHACARTWHHGPTRLLCIDHPFASRFPEGTAPSILTIYDRRLSRRAPRSVRSRAPCPTGAPDAFLMPRPRFLTSC